MSITVWKWAEREPFGVGPLPRATPACRHAGGPGAREPCGAGSAADPVRTTGICFEHNCGPLSYCEPSPREGLAIAFEDRAR